ncbi:hypothetical protein EDD57_14117 [Baia soyae]|uniref:Uncharacterized protein n=1 Tax=Baia soyae TaxID=1544746 RepID=A0A4R2RNM0_9BACL|nr:hypothetical protein EDD57_14117 [Baia soyae]
MEIKKKIRTKCTGLFRGVSYLKSYLSAGQLK